MNAAVKQSASKAKATPKPAAQTREPAATVTKAATATPGKPAAKPDAKAASPKAAPPRKAGGPDSPGVIGSIAEFLKAGSAKQPLTKEAILAKLKERFPERDEKSMMRTINCQVPARMAKEKGLNVCKTDDGGFYVA